MSIANAPDDWRTRAACRLEDPTIFDPPEGYGAAMNEARANQAKAVCQRCPVVKQCLDDARAHRDSGIRGGVLLAAGKPLPLQGARGPKPQGCGTVAGYKRHIRYRTETCQDCRTAYTERRNLDRARGAA